MRGWSDKAEPINREYRGWYLSQIQSNLWTCYKSSWTAEQQDKYGWKMPEANTQAEVKRWIDNHGGEY